MANMVLMAYVVADILFLISGCIELGFSIIVSNSMFGTPTDGFTAARNLIYQRFPLTAGIANAVVIFATFLLTLPGIVTTSRTWLKISGYMVVVSALFSLSIGVFLWVLTLRSKNDFANIWVEQDSHVQDLLQTAFNCCGYFNSTAPAFVTDAACTSPAAAALQRGCSAPVTSFANIFTDDIFTAVFGIVAVDAFFILATACLLKERKDMERYRHIDEKNGF